MADCFRLMTYTVAIFLSPWTPVTSSFSSSFIDGFSELIHQDPCYFDDGRPKRCVPDFVNAAFSRSVVASSTCGTPATRHCPGRVWDTVEISSIITTGASAHPDSNCFACDAKHQQSRHPPLHLTDLNNPNNVTCWVSGLDPRQVSLTVNLGKKFEVTYVSLQFCGTPPPANMAIYKSSDHGKTWTPMQYYSNQCRKVYGKSTRGTVTKANEQEAVCSDAHSIATTASGARIAFVALDGRPSAQDFENSPALQDFVTATDIRILLGRAGGVETGEMGGGHSYYSLSDLAVGGRCKCNGHAHRCIVGKNGKMECECRHNTAGVDCQLCKPFHYDRPWSRGTEGNTVGCIGK